MIKAYLLDERCTIPKATYCIYDISVTNAKNKTYHFLLNLVIILTEELTSYNTTTQRSRLNLRSKKMFQSMQRKTSVLALTETSQPFQYFH